ncbi:tripartite tricarboxylate transporter substrate binding protein [Pigmentiphaga daeguensis]|uniref:Tripartite tricarboxylate transporter substrate binding protein n=1 Tax=Pigmentiphaga daeguensis TaxID=414049 RepID=A0ABP3M787_9BURK
MNIRPFFPRIAAGACAAACFWTAPALAQGSYPQKPIRVVIPFTPGGSADLSGRTVARKLSERLGQPVVVENIGGAGGEIGVNAVAQAPADGYTILITPNGPITTAGRFKKLSYDPLKDLQPVGVVTLLPLFVAVNAQFPARNLAEFIDYAKKHPGVVNYGNPGPGSASHLNGELLSYAAGIKLVAVPYKGNGPAAAAVASGETQAGFGDFPSFAPFGASGSGRVRLLAAFNETRTAVAPDVPTVSEAGLPAFKPIVSWIGMFLPAKTPAAITNRLAQELDHVVRDPEVAATLARVGGEPASMSPERFGGYIRDQIRMLDQLIADAGIRID